MRAEWHLGRPQPHHLSLEISHLEMNAVPAARHLTPTIGERAFARAALATQQQPHAVTRYRGKGGGRVDVQSEAEESRVELDGRRYIVDHVAHADLRHRSQSPLFVVSFRFTEPGEIAISETPLGPGGALLEACSMGESAGFAAARVRRSATPSTLRRREGRQNSADS